MMDQLDTLDRNKKLFPQKMWDLIHDERYQFCLRWSDDGQLVYLNRDEFEESYLKKPCNQFNTQKSISFVRQMNMYGFRKVDDCYYENDNFKKNCYHLLKNMIRRHPNKAPFNDYFPTTTPIINPAAAAAAAASITQLPVSVRSDPASFDTNSNIANAANNNNTTSTTTTSNTPSSDASAAVLQDVVEAIKLQQQQHDAARYVPAQKAQKIEPAHHHHHHLMNNVNHHLHQYHHHRLHHQQQQQQQNHHHQHDHHHQQHQFHPDDLSTSSASPISDMVDDDVMDTQHLNSNNHLHNHHHFINNNANTMDRSVFSNSFVRQLLQLHQQPQDLSSHHHANKNNSSTSSNNSRMSKSSSTSSGGRNGTPSPTPANRFIANQKDLVNSHSNSNNGSLSSSPSPSLSIDNNNINHMLNGHNFQQQLSNMVHTISNHSGGLRLGNNNNSNSNSNSNSNNNNNNNSNSNNNNNNCPIKYDPIQVSEIINQAQIPPELQLELQNHLELQQQVSQLPPVSPLSNKLVTEICSRRNALMDQSALLDAARYTEKFLNVLLDDALLIAQHSAGMDPADTTAQPACSSIDVSSLTLALKLLPSKLLSSLQNYNNK